MWCDFKTVNPNVGIKYQISDKKLQKQWYISWSFITIIALVCFHNTVLITFISYKMNCLTFSLVSFIGLSLLFYLNFQQGPYNALLN